MMRADKDDPYMCFTEWKAVRQQRQLLHIYSMTQRIDDKMMVID